MHTTNGETSQNLVAEREVSEGVRQVVRREERLMRYVKSTGHIQFSGGYEYIERDTEIYRADMSNTIDIQTGIRTGARFECSIYAANRHPILKYNKSLIRRLEVATA